MPFGVRRKSGGEAEMRAAEVAGEGVNDERGVPVFLYAGASLGKKNGKVGTSHVTALTLQKQHNTPTPKTTQKKTPLKN
jgi:hypothetical protein